MQIMYDTNILLQILRDEQSITKLEKFFDLSEAEESVSISLVTLAEIRSLSIQFRWGAIRRAKMNEAIRRLTTLDINVPEIIDRYVEID